MANYLTTDEIKASLAKIDFTDRRLSEYIKENEKSMNELRKYFVKILSHQQAEIAALKKSLQDQNAKTHLKYVEAKNQLKSE